MVMDNLKIAFVTPEAVPYAKTGGLADVSGALPRTLARMGHSVRLFMPKYRQVAEGISDIRRLGLKFECRIGAKSYESDIFRTVDEDCGLETFFIGNDHFFNRGELYIAPATKKDYADNDERFIFFSQAVLKAVKGLNWNPDIIHANDWQSALIIPMLRILYKNDQCFARTRAIFTIHNMGYQGQFPPETFEKLGVDKSYFYPIGPFEFWGDVNFMKSAIYFADKITTVSPTYACEIQQSDEFGKGLQGVLAERSADLIGILNGVDYSQWSPEKDRLIPRRYGPANLSGKKKNKLALLHKCGFPIRMEHPLIGIISRLDVQKGFDLLEEIFAEVMDLDLQLVLLGTGDEKYQEFLKEIEIRYPDKFKAFLGFDNRLAHLIEAGCDMFLMPSHYEPCGLNQMYSLKYGTVPIIRKTGGLADSVSDFDERNLTGTGFAFTNYDSQELLQTIKRAVRTFGRRRIWSKIVKQGMSKDFSWDSSAKKYLELYESLAQSD